MKQCKDCKWDKTCLRFNPDWISGFVCESYIRKRWLWWAWWIPIVLLLTLLLGGCAMLEHKDDAGNVTRYFRLGDQSIGVGNITLPDGTVLNFIEQKSELPTVTFTVPIGSIEINGKKVRP